jgi:hypothetical protein
MENHYLATKVLDAECREFIAMCRDTLSNIIGDTVEPCVIETSLPDMLLELDGMSNRFHIAIDFVPALYNFTENIPESLAMYLYTETKRDMLRRLHMRGIHVINITDVMPQEQVREMFYNELHKLTTTRVFVGLPTGN